MADKTSIQWTATYNADGTVTPGASWNPIIAINRKTKKRGWHCVHVSEACRFCYAERQNVLGLRGGTGLAYTAQNEKLVEIQLHQKTLEQPLHWRKPRKIFVCSMTDLFLETIPLEFVQNIWRVMIRAHRERGHIFQVLTKRPEYMAHALGPKGFGWYATLGPVPCPEPGIWLGVSVEDQPTFEARWPYLRNTPAAVRFLSYEPALGPLELGSAVGRKHAAEYHDKYGPCTCDKDMRLDWVIAGGESGPHARPSHPDWFRSVRDQCQAAGVPFFFKQWGEWHPTKTSNVVRPRDAGKLLPYTTICSSDHSQIGKVSYHAYPSEPQDGIGVFERLEKIGKESAGRLLDGREWNEFPQCSNAPARTP